MSDLRSRCLTAMTEAMVDEAPALFDDYAVVALDALLGVLHENGVVLRAVLKPTTEEDA